MEAMSRFLSVSLMANRLANALRSGGVQRGDRVAIYLPNSVASVVGIFAALKAGGVFVVVNNTTKPDKLAGILNNCQASALLIEGRNGALAKQILEHTPSLRLCIGCGSTEKGWISEADLSSSRARLHAFDLIQDAYPSEAPP